MSVIDCRMRELVTEVLESVLPGFGVICVFTCVVIRPGFRQFCVVRVE